MKTWVPAFLIAVVLSLAEGLAESQQRAKVPRVAYLGGTAPRLFEAFQQGLRELDYVEGQNIIVEGGITHESALHSRAAELVRLKPEVIVVASASAADATLNATRTIPIVLTHPGVDPIATGLVATLERPGGNVTGVGGMATQVGGKWLELLKEAIRGCAVLRFSGIRMTSAAYHFGRNLRSLPAPYVSNYYRYMFVQKREFRIKIGSLRNSVPGCYG